MCTYTPTDYSQGERILRTHDEFKMYFQEQGIHNNQLPIKGGFSLFTAFGLHAKVRKVLWL